MINYGQYFAPSSEWLPRIQSGFAKVDLVAQRVVDTRTHRYLAALRPVPGTGLDQALESAGGLAGGGTAHLAPALDALQWTSAAGALASVANLGVSCAGFAIVLHKLGRIEAKVDEALAKLGLLQERVDELRGHQEALSIARIRSGSDSLERAVFADTTAARNSSASRARDLFQEARNLHARHWEVADPWSRSDVPPSVALEMQGKYVACATGEIQAEFLLGDRATFLHCVSTVVSQMQTSMNIDARDAFRLRNRHAHLSGAAQDFGHSMDGLAGQLRHASSVTNCTLARLASFSSDADLPEELELPPHQVARVMRHATGDDVYLLGSPKSLEEWRRAA